MAGPARLVPERPRAAGALLAALLVAAGGLDARGQAPTPQLLFVSGTVERTGGAELDPFLILDGGGAFEAPRRGEAAYAFELLDAADVVLVRADLDLRFEQEIHRENESEVRAIETTPFSLTVPLPPSARTARLLRGATILAQRSRTAHAPELEITELRVTNDHAVDLVWRASDTDGDALTYAVSYAVDGTDFENIAIGLEASSLRLELDDLARPAGAVAALRVRASDGWNVATATERLP